MSIDGRDPGEVIELLRPHLLEERAAKLDAVAAGRLEGLGLLLEDLHDPHNGGAALRSSESMGVLRVDVVSPRQAFRTSPRVTQGCEKWLDLRRWSDVDACAAELRRLGYRLYAAVPGEGPSVDELDPLERKVLAFGNEHLGLSPRLVELADGRFRIPMYGFSQSLNVSVSVAVCLHVASTARRRALGREGDLDGPALLELRARYHRLDVRGAPGILQRR